MPEPPSQANSNDVARQKVIRDAPPPFNKRAADVILRSSDHVDFRVRQSILAESSPFFEAMFSLPQLPESRKRKERDETEYRDGIPIVDMSEGSRVLDALLRFCYPVEDPALPYLKVTCEVLEAARKFDMTYVVAQVKKQFLSRAAQQPLQAYIVAVTRGWVDEMREAAKCTLRREMRWDAYIPEMEQISAGAWYRLRAYHSACSEAVSKLVDTTQPNEDGVVMEWLTTTQWPWFTCLCSQPASQKPYTAARIPCRSAPWWEDYLKDVKLKLKDRPHRATIVESDAGEQHLDRTTCRTCLSQKISRKMHLKEFEGLLIQEIDKVMSRIQLEVRI
ncbi:uncharacterized protein B0H18DRAFT_1012086 [Fomitopsis serialis]|uniref:uncharacterized protein n=1 Tax=Fomitopsis serialis TaxID=139415 RepID=UPI00200885AF|nr:uncharacterized protein B0H18DRAFT_1012086 [Neoantrodia serialis]KAH9924414.1 hypothetical protein B0H18DRAFT_1012086 [Neoantrodia serialis]